jgi:hypothetical protein
VHHLSSRLRSSLTAGASDHACRTFRYRAQALEPGTRVNNVTLSVPDGNPGNDRSNATVVVAFTCAWLASQASPLASCPAGQAYAGPDAKNLTSASQFAAACCVSGVHCCQGLLGGAACKPPVCPSG